MLLGSGARLEELDPHLNDPALWNDPDAAKKVTQEAARLRRVVESFERLEGDIQGLSELFEIASDDEIAELQEEHSKIQKTLDTLYRETLFSGEHDDSAAILTLKPGAGGTRVFRLGGGCCCGCTAALPSGKGSASSC